MDKKLAVRTLVGKVTSNRMNKTVVVEIEKLIRHEKYDKYTKRISKLFAHNEQNDCEIGDIVVISETKPYAKNKAWQVLEIKKRAI